jgi:chemotaxis protein MotA
MISMGVALGLFVTLGCLIGGFVAMGGHVAVLIQPWEFVIIGGTALGTFLCANPMSNVKDTGGAIVEAVLGKSPTERDYLDVLALMYALMRDLRSKPSSEFEAQIDAPNDSPIFQAYPNLKKNPELVGFVCDYFRLILIGSARTHEIEALMDEEIHTISRDSLKPYHALVGVADGLPALGIVAAVLGVIKAMGALDQSPEVLGHLIGSALVGTFAGIFLSYSVFGPIATKVKILREKRNRLYVIVKQTLLAFMNGAMPQIAIEHGRKTISSKYRPTIDEVETETVMGGTAPDAAKAAA